MLKDYEIKYREIFSRNLRDMLYKTEKTQAEMARYLGVSKTAVTKWCKGLSDPRMDKVDKMCEFFGCTRNDLMLEKANTVPKTGQDKYYNDNEAAELVQFLYENPEYRVLFDASRKIKKEDIELVKAILDKMRTEDTEF